MVVHPMSSLAGLLDTTTEAGAADAEPSGLSALIQVLMRHSYVPALITMMVSAPWHGLRPSGVLSI